jgi:hypothetical protein
VKLAQDEREIGKTELEALRSIAESTKATATMILAQSGELRSLSVKMDDVHERVIRLEEQRHGRDIDRLTKERESMEQRLVALEMSQATMLAKFNGAGTLASLVKSYVPILALLIAAFLWLQSGFKFEK